MRYVYHLGVHKTGSTLIQKNLEANLDALRAQGIWYVNAELPRALNKQRKVIRQLRNPAKPPPEPEALAGINRRIDRLARLAGAHTVLLSEENRIGPPMHQELLWGHARPGFYPEADRCMTHVIHGQPREGMVFFLYSRDPASYAMSLYSEAVRMGQTTLDLDSFLRSVDLASIDYAALCDRLRSVNPRIDVILRPFEPVMKDASSFLRQSFKTLGIKNDNLVFDTTRVRSRLDSTQIDELLRLQRDTEMRSIRRQHLREAIIAREPDPGARLTPPDWFADFFA